MIFLDSGPLGLVTHPKANAESTNCIAWLLGLLEKEGVKVCIPEICDYEIRRDYVRRVEKNTDPQDAVRAKKALENLDQLKTVISYVQINTPMMNRSAQLWASARNNGISTADDKSLDCDVILAAQALVSTPATDNLIIATSNVRHLARFAKAQKWEDIKL